nr:ATP-binding protein [uncultured Desulfobacter sp.]
MFRTITSKISAIVTLLILLFVVNYGLLTYFLNEQKILATQMLEMSQAERKLHLLNGKFYEIRFWEKKVLEEKNPDAIANYGSSISSIKTELRDLEDLETNKTIQSKLHSIRVGIVRHETIFNEAQQLKTTQNLHRTSLNTSYRSLISNVLNNDMRQLFKPLFNLNHFFIVYIMQQDEPVYRSLVMVVDYLYKKIEQIHSSDDRTKEYLLSFKNLLQEDFKLANLINNTEEHFELANNSLFEQFDNVFTEASALFKSKYIEAESKRKNLNNMALSLTIISVALLLFVFYLFSKTIVTPIRSLAMVMRKVKEGNFDERFFWAGNKKDELIKYGYHFNTMLDTLQENEEEKIKVSLSLEEHKKLALVGKIAGKMAHDFNNILGSIMGQSELGLFKCNEPETLKRLQVILDQSLRGRNLTKNLVAFAKDQEPKYEYFYLNEKIELVLSLLKKDLEGIEIRKEGLSENINLLADPGMVEHCLVNIFQNSIHALSKSENPFISIQLRQSNGTVFIIISDNGCGIPEAHIDKIFEPSFSLKGSRDELASYDSSIKGSGYGMANVNKYIELHNGKITVRSQLNIGTTVELSFPLIRKKLTKEEAIIIKNESCHNNKRILLVEDEIQIAEVQRFVLTNEPCNHIVDVAYTGEAALKFFDNNDYDLISLDYILPGNINGKNLYDHIRSKNKTIPILFISGNIEFLESIKDLKKGDRFVDHISKPCQNIDYLNSIKLLLDKTNS